MPPTVIVKLSGGDVVDIVVENHESILVEVRQYHADFQSDEPLEWDEDVDGLYEVVPVMNSQPWPTDNDPCD